MWPDLKWILSFILPFAKPIKHEWLHDQVSVTQLLRELLLRVWIKLLFLWNKIFQEATSLSIMFY